MIVYEAEILTALGIAGSATDADRIIVATLQPMVERAIESYLGFRIEQMTRDELLPTTAQPDNDLNELTSWDIVGGQAVAFYPGTRIISVSYTPLRSVVSLYEDRASFGGQAPNAFAPGTLLTAGQHYYVDYDQTGICRSGQLIRFGAWPSMPRSVKVTYVSGYTPAELRGDPSATVNVSHIRLACLKQHVWEFNEMRTFQSSSTRAGRPVKSEALADWNATYEGNVPGTIELLPNVKELLAREMNLTQFY